MVVLHGNVKYITGLLFYLFFRASVKLEIADNSPQKRKITP